MENVFYKKYVNLSITLQDTAINTHYKMIVKSLERDIDALLETETKESLEKWLFNKRYQNINKMQNTTPDEKSSYRILKLSIKQVKP